MLIKASPYIKLLRWLYILPDCLKISCQKKKKKCLWWMKYIMGYAYLKCFSSWIVKNWTLYLNFFLQWWAHKQALPLLPAGWDWEGGERAISGADENLRWNCTTQWLHAQELGHFCLVFGKKERAQVIWNVPRRQNWGIHSSKHSLL